MNICDWKAYLFVRIGYIGYPQLSSFHYFNEQASSTWVLYHVHVINF